MNIVYVGFCKVGRITYVEKDPLGTWRSGDTTNYSSLYEHVIKRDTAVIVYVNFMKVNVTV